MMEPTAHPFRLAFAREQPQQLAALLATQPTATLAASLAEMPSSLAAAVVARLPRSTAIALLENQANGDIENWLNTAKLEHALAIALTLEDSRRLQLLNALTDTRRAAAIKRLLVYPQSAVGAFVDTSVSRLSVDAPLAEGIGILVAETPAAERSIWLVDDAGQYEGLLDTNAALVARNEQVRLGQLCVQLAPLRAETPLHRALTAAEWQEHPELPVVDHHGHFLGAVQRRALAARLQGQLHDDRNLANDISELADDYFRVMAEVISDLVGNREGR